MKKLFQRFALFLIPFCLIVGLVNTSQAHASGNFFNCPAGLHPAVTCTYINGPVTIKDRYNNNLVTWQTGTSVAMGHWTIDYWGQCGTHGDQYVWSVFWLQKDYGVTHIHSTIIGDTWMQDGAHSDWANRIADTYTNVFDPWYYIHLNSNPGTCDGSGWDFLVEATPFP